jgi:glycerophosphoryl diester phosphodiesterase
LSKSLLVKPNYVRIYGHRGARGDIVENSIEGFKYTFDLGIKAIEFDVVISKDNIPVLFHDFRLNIDMVKNSNGNWIENRDLKIINLTYNELQTYSIESLKPDSKY